MTTKTIALRAPLIGHAGARIAEIVVREPTYEEYSEIGDPYTITTTPGGSPFVAENLDAIRDYMRLLIVSPDDPLILRKAGFRTAREVKAAIMDFFLRDGEAREGSDEASPTSPTSSSSTEGSRPQTSIG